MAKRFRRRIWLIDTDIQVRLGLRIVVYLVAYLVLFFALSVGERFLALYQDLPRAEAWAAAWLEAAEAGERLVTPLLLALGCMLLHGILLLHKLAGPAYRLRLALSRLADGDLTDFVHLRGGDYLARLAVSYNEGVGRLCADVREVRRRGVEMLETLSDEGDRRRIGDLLEVLAAYHTGEEEPESGEPEEEGAGMEIDEEAPAVEA